MNSGIADLLAAGGLSRRPAQKPRARSGEALLFRPVLVLGDNPRWVREWDHDLPRSARPGQKAVIAAARNVCEAKMAEREILHRDALRKARTFEEVAKLNEELQQDRDRATRDRDRQIAAIRGGGTSA
jgi:hypothetical protein